jgi:uncharacterized protein (TIGR03437 family)
MRNVSSYFPILLLLSGAAFGQPLVNQFIDDTVVQQISLTVNPTDWANFLANYESDTYYHATFTWNGVSESIGIRQHGNASRSPIKPNIDVNFAKYDSTQTFMGEAFLLLKANNEDPSNLHEWIAMQLYRQMGFPAARESFAVVTVNGTLLGFYMTVEHDDTAFVERNLGEDNGYYYEWARQSVYDFEELGTNPQVYLEYLNLKSNQAVPDLANFSSLVRVINLPFRSEGDFLAALHQYMDPKMFLTYVATESVLSEADGIVGGIVGMNNFDLYQFQGTTNYTLTPWAKDLSFSDPNRDIFTGFTVGPNINLLAARLIAIPEYQNFYFDQLTRAAGLLGATDGWADSEVTREYGLINTAASNDPNKQCLVTGVLIPCGTTDFENGISWDHSFLASRAPFVLAELSSNGYQGTSTDPVISSVSATGLTTAQGMTPGGLVQVNGSLLSTSATTSQSPLPRSLANTFVAVEGVRAPLFLTSSGQIQIQVPWDVVAGPATVVVSVGGNMSNSFTSIMQNAAPVVLSVTHSDGTSITAQSPASGGETIVIYMTGLGAVNTEPALGTLAPAAPAPLTTYPQVSLGNTALTLVFAGITPNAVGVYQVSVVLPQPIGQSAPAALNISASGQTASVQLPVE